MSKNIKNNNFSLDQQQKLEDIGVNLNRIRVAQNISLETVADQTHISKRLLEAIEAGDVTKLPEPFYVRALVNKFARQIGATEVDLELQPSSDHNTVANSSSLNNSGSYRPSFRLRSRHLYLLYILLVVVSVKSITKLVERPVIVDRTVPVDSVTNLEIEPTEPAVELNQSKAVPQLISQSSNSQAVTVGINLQERCWLKVMVDGKVAFEGTLAKGTQRQWTGDREVTIRAGNAGGVVISSNNQQQVLGAPGQVEEITYTVN